MRSSDSEKQIPLRSAPQNPTETPPEEKIAADLEEMVVALGPGKFYGSSLPRPRIYTDVKFNEERVDPPVPVMDPLMSWADEAHWSMGGLSFQRHRLQGRIEGNVKKLRAEQEKTWKKAQKNKSPKRSISSSNGKDGESEEGKSPVTPPAPVAVKRRRRLVKIGDVEEEREMKRTARKLGDEFDKVADEIGAAMRTRSQRAEDEIKMKSKGQNGKGKSNKEEEEGVESKGTRSSPRLFGKRG